MNKNRGVTLISLVITIIVLVIIAGISVYSGKDIIKKAQLEELKTNMLLIEAKAKGYLEEANFKIGKDTSQEKVLGVRSDVYEAECGLKKANESISAIGNTEVTEDFYLVTDDTLNKWGLNEMEIEEGEYYVIQFKDTITAENTSLSVEIYNTKGYNGKYSLTEIEQIEE